MGWPHVNVSHMAMRKPSVARTASLYATGFNLLFIPAPYIVGIMALIILPSLDNPELAVFQVADTVLPDFAVGIVMAGIMAAIMSTADALLLQSGTIASQDLFQRFVRPTMSDRQSVWVSRFTVLLLAIIGYVVAVGDPPAVAEVVIFSTTVLGAAFVPVYIAAAWWKKANVPGAIASMLLGTVSSVGWQLSGLVDVTAIDPMGVGIVASTLGIIVVSLATQKSHPVPAHIVAALEETAKIGPIPARMLTGQNDALASQVPKDV